MIVGLFDEISVLYTIYDSFLEICIILLNPYNNPVSTIPYVLLKRNLNFREILWLPTKVQS